MDRGAGILLPITSLPSKYGIGAKLLCPPLVEILLLVEIIEQQVDIFLHHGDRLPHIAHDMRSRMCIRTGRTYCGSRRTYDCIIGGKDYGCTAAGWNRSKENADIPRG